MARCRNPSGGGWSYLSGRPPARNLLFRDFSVAPLVLGERWNSRTLIASLLIFAGVGMVTKRGRSIAIDEVAEHPEALAH
jgi:hypothetical protein